MSTIEPQISLEESRERQVPEISVVIPCLNEAPTIEECVARAWRALDSQPLAGEVIVVDNGSDDGSGALAAAGGAYVIYEPERGYGSAYLAGLGAARGDYVVMADADLTYDFNEIPRFVAELHARHGVALHCGVIVKSLEREADRSERVAYGEGEAVSADVVVAGVGMERHLALAEQAGLEVDGGIVVDEFGQTSAPGVYAAGDVAAFPHPLYGRRLRLESWRHAQNHGVAVGRAMAGAPVAYDDVPWFWTDQHGVNLQIAGLPTEAVRTVLRGPGAFTAIHLAEDGRVVGVTAADNPREIRAGTALIKARARPDPARLQDASVPLQSLIPR